MFRFSATTSNRLIKSSRLIKRSFALVNDYSVRKRMTIGIGGFLVVAAGCSYAGYKVHKSRVQKRIPPTPIKEEQTLIPPEITEVVEKKEDTKSEEESYLPWWTGVKEISLYINKENSEKIEEISPALFDVKPRPKVMLVINPNPADANEYAPFMKDEINMKVVAEIHDEHAQVLLLDLGSLPSIYRYPNLVISCQDKEDNAMYSSVYGRLLIDRAMKAGLLKEETESVYVPVENKENVEVGEYYNYPGCHITITDLREKEITIKGRVCTSRGMDGKNDICNEEKHEAECSWCVFMKSGPCVKSFTQWQSCVADNKEDDAFVEKCSELTRAMTECVEAHPEYYGVPEDMEDDDEDETIEEEEEDASDQQEEETVEQQEETVEQEKETSTQLTPEEIKNEELHSTESISQQFAKQE